MEIVPNLVHYKTNTPSSIESIASITIVELIKDLPLILLFVDVVVVVVAECCYGFIVTVNFFMSVEVGWLVDRLVFCRVFAVGSYLYVISTASYTKEELHRKLVLNVVQ